MRPKLRRLALTASLALLFAAAPAAATTAPSNGSNVVARLDRLTALIDAWDIYKLRHLDPSGRVVDDANKDISHSEGQGYGMLIAVKLADREAFDAMWAWTRLNLGVRDDRLFAWRWEPGSTPHVTDRNNATDGDILIVWALVEAADLWDEPSYRQAASLIAADIARLTVAETPFGPALLPAAAGFSAADRKDGPVVNLSYSVFPARSALERAAPEVDWDRLFASGRAVLEATQTLPPEWTSLSGPAPVPADKFDPVFGYNAIRVPLYLAWAGTDPDLVERFARIGDRGGPAVVDVASGVAVSPFSAPGFTSVATLVDCALSPDGPRRPVELAAVPQKYYPETLNLLSAIAQLEVYASCLD